MSGGEVGTVPAAQRLASLARISPGLQDKKFVLIRSPWASAEIS